MTYRNYLLTLLLVILAFNYVDRLALGLLMQHIKIDLDLTDTQLGLMSGIAFTLFYAVMGVPLARWADRGNRRTIITVTTAIWSVAVALCGMAASFMQLLLIRIGVAVGEAGCIPPAHSLISQYFDRAERPRAIARYMMGNPLSLLIGYFLAGWLNEIYGWRMTFVLLSLPGLGLALLAWLTLREPRVEDGKLSAAAAPPPYPHPQSLPPTPPPPPSIREVFVTLWRNATFRQLLLGFSVAYFFGTGIGKWQPAFFVRSFGLESGPLGTWFAACGLVGVVGMYLGGELASRYAARNERLQLQAIVFAFAASAAISAAIYLSTHYYMGFAFLALSFVVYNMTSGALFATIQSLVPSHMRAMAIAIVYFFANLIGLGLGPLASGALSDLLRPTFGEDSLRYALLIMCPGYLWAAVHVWRASRTVARDLAAVPVEARG